MSRVAFLIVSICALLSVDAQNLLAQSSRPGYRAYVAAENLRRQNKCRDAIAQYDEALKEDPRNYKYYFQRGKCEYKLGEMDMAKESFKMTVDNRRNFTPAYALLAKIYKNEKDYANAIYYYEAAARYEGNPSRKVQYKLLLINLLLKEDRIQDAKKHVDEAKEIDPENPNLLFYDGEIASLEEDWQSARRAYQKAIESDRLRNVSASEKAKYYYGLGLALSKTGDTVGANEAWSKANFGPYKDLIAQQRTSANHVYFYKVAVSYYLNGAYEESEAQISKALDIQRNFASAYVLKARIENKRGNSSRAIRYYQDAIKHEKSADKKAYYYQIIANLEMEQQKFGDALQAISQAFKVSEKASKSSSLMYQKAKAEYGGARYEDAVQTLEQLLTMGGDPKSRAQYHFLLGMSAKKSADYEKAREAFKNAMFGPYKPAAKEELEMLEEG